MLAFAADHEVWLAGERYDAGEHQVEDPSAELVLHAGSAHAAGSITVTDGLDLAHVQSQEDTEAALAAAMGTADPVTGQWDGPWADSNREAYEAKLAAEAEASAAAQPEDGEAQ